MKNILLPVSIVLLLLISATISAQESVTISGYVTGYENNPLDSVTVSWRAENTNSIVEVLTGKDGFYTAQVPKGRYYSMIAINFNEYIHTSVLPNDDRRLEFWGWNVIVDRDTTFNIKYDRMEVYGLNVFRIQNAVPAYTIYFRPMSLTRTLEWMNNQTTELRFGPTPEKADINVYINGEPVHINIVQEVKEYVDDSQYFIGYLLSVALPKQESTSAYDIFKVEITDKENGDRGEGVYFYERKQYER